MSTLTEDQRLLSLLRRIYNHPYSQAGLRVRDEYGHLIEQVAEVVDPSGIGTPVACEHGYHGDCPQCWKIHSSHQPTLRDAAHKAVSDFVNSRKCQSDGDVCVALGALQLMAGCALDLVMHGKREKLS